MVQTSFAVSGLESKGNVITLDGISFSVFGCRQLKEETPHEREPFLILSCDSKHASTVV